ncbi:MAG: hypothetical protein ACLRFE_00620 [Clostridia bacterium]
MYYVSKSYMLASIMKTKMKYFQDAIVTDRELNVLTNAMQKRFNEFNIKAIITEDVDNVCFEFRGDSYFISDKYGYTIEDVKDKYQAYLPLDILAMIWDEKFILKGITKNLNSMLERVEETCEQSNLTK